MGRGLIEPEGPAPGSFVVTGTRLPLVRRVRGGRLRVEHGSEAEAAAVLEIHKDVLAEGRYFITEPDEFLQTRAWKAAAIRELVGATNSCFLVARLEGVLVGALMAQGGHLRRSRHVARIEIFLAPDARGQGLGRALMDAAITWGRDNPEVSKLSLTVFTDNAPAIALYQAVGFTVEGRRLREYRLQDGSYRDDQVMGLWLEEAP